MKNYEKLRKNMKKKKKPIKDFENKLRVVVKKINDFFSSLLLLRGGGRRRCEKLLGFFIN